MNDKEKFLKLMKEFGLSVEDDGDCVEVFRGDKQYDTNTIVDFEFNMDGSFRKVDTYNEENF